MSVTLREAAEKRAEAAKQTRDTTSTVQRAAPPDGVAVRRSAPQRVEMRTETVDRDGKSYVRLTGMASVYEHRYEMWDFYGPYEEEVAEGAGANSLAKSPDVVFLLNHTGIPFARTISGTLDLSEPGGGLLSEAFLNPKRQDVQDLVSAVADGAITEMSFAFRIMDGRWSPDYLNYRINEYDLDRGDTSAVTFGANPATSIEARAQVFALRNEARLMGLDLTVPEPAEAEPWRVHERAARDLRTLRAALIQGGLSDQERGTLTALVDVLLSEPERLAAEGTLDGALGVRETPIPKQERATSLGVDFLARELDAMRSLA